MAIWEQFTLRSMNSLSTKGSRQSLGLKLHPGVKKFFDEKGIKLL